VTGPSVGSAWPGASALVTDIRAPALNLDQSIGQFQYTYRFELVDAVSGLHLGDVHPIREASLRHDTSQITKRSLGLSLGRADTAAINVLTDRISPFMVIPGIRCPDTVSGDWPLGRYQFVDNPRRVFTSGRLGQPQLSDEMFLVDQPILAGINGVGLNVDAAIIATLSGLAITFDIEPSNFTSADSWGIGKNRGQILEALSVAGDYWSPWFDNFGVLRFRRTFDPAAAVPDINLDVGARVLRSDILETDEVLTAPNTFVVISNNSETPEVPVVGIATVPINAPNSVANRGFAITKVVDLQISDSTQAAAVANGLAQRQAIFEQVQLSTAADPRHDGYNVVRWQGANWLELSWSLTLKPGEPMSHVMRKSYGPVNTT
jgi:hypothetical protein